MAVVLSIIGIVIAGGAVMVSFYAVNREGRLAHWRWLADQRVQAYSEYLSLVGPDSIATARAETARKRSAVSTKMRDELIDLALDRDGELLDSTKNAITTIMEKATEQIAISSTTADTAIDVGIERGAASLHVQLVGTPDVIDCLGAVANTNDAESVERLKMAMRDSLAETQGRWCSRIRGSAK